MTASAKSSLTGMKRIAAIFLTAAILTGIMISGILSPVNLFLADSLYQKPVALDGQIMLISIDQESLDALGPFGSWGRGRMAQVVEALNAQPEYAPAVIGIDVLFAGESDDPQADKRLADACKDSVPVIAASAASFAPSLVELTDGSFYMDEYAIAAYDRPYEALRRNVVEGHINSMFDEDGILRHGIWQLDLPNQTKVPSFHRAIYETYCETIGVPPERSPSLDARHHWYVPFQAEPGGYNDGYGVIDLLNGDIAPDAYAGKIVLIGPYAAGMQDDFLTAIDHAQKMYGIEYQANMVDALLKGEHKKEVSATVQAILLFAVCVAAAAFFAGRRLFTSTIAWVAICAGYLAGCMAGWQLGYVLMPLYIPLAVTLIYLFQMGMGYLKAAMEKRRITATFERYVAPEIVAELLKEGTEATALGGKLTDIAVLFVDIRGFTSMSEILEPPEVVAILNRYLTLTSDCIFKNGGTLDKFVGDCTMAFWGAPLAQEDCIYKAVKTAFDMIEGAKALSKELTEHFGRTVDFGIGVHYGPAVVGNIGSPNRMDYTAIGDTVNTAARLEANAPGGKVYVSRVVADALKKRVRFTSLGDTIQLKGKAAGFEILSAEELLMQNMDAKKESSET